MKKVLFQAWGMERRDEEGLAWGLYGVWTEITIRLVAADQLSAPCRVVRFSDTPGVQIVPDLAGVLKPLAPTRTIVPLPLLLLLSLFVSYF